MKPGDVATALFTFSDQIGAKKRPVLVVSSEEYNTTIDGDIIVAAISSKPPRNRFEYMIDAWKMSGLKMPSKVRAGTLQTVSTVLLQKIGQIPEEEFLEIKRLLTEVFGLGIN
jgi:mRNA interferase MazF